VQKFVNKFRISFPMILGIDTSCDDTSIGIISNGRIFANIVSSQEDIHKEYGGIVPEVASRIHVEIIDKILAVALAEAKVSLRDIKKIGVTVGPGLIGSLLVGIEFAKALAYTLAVPVIGINHIEAHLFIATLSSSIDFPCIGLVVSGAHTELIYIKSWGDYELLGQSRDDAAGEAFDKTAKLLHLDYPGGRKIEELAKLYDKADKINFPKALDKKFNFDFSFSGIKTAVARYIKFNDNYSKAEVAYSFQKAVVDILVKKTISSCLYKQVKWIILSGGVAANFYLRETFLQAANKYDINLIYPSKELCTDNGVMVASLAGIKECGLPLVATPYLKLV